MTTLLNTSSNIQTLCISTLQQYPSINHILLLLLCCEYAPEHFTQYNAEQLDEIASSLRNDEDWTTICQATSFQDDSVNNSEYTLHAVLQNIQNLLHYSKTEGFADVIGYLLLEDSKSGDDAEAVTPTSIANLVARLMQPQESNSVYDPACRAGGLLAACSHHAVVDVFGQEASQKRWITTQLTLMLYGKKPFGIKHSDCLLQPIHQENQLQRFDIVVGNPPWGRSVKNIELKDNFQRFQWGMPSTRLDYAYISHMVASMCPENGRMAVLAQHGILFRSATEGAIRQRLIEDNLLDAVIALPEKMMPFMSAPLVLLIFKQQRPDTSVLWLDASKDYIADKYQNTLSEKHINRICESYIQRESIPQYATLSHFETIKANQFKLNIPLYIKPVQETAPSDLQTLQKEREQLMKQWERLQQKLDEQLQDS